MQEEVEEKVASATALHAKWRKLRQAGASDELEWTTIDLQSQLRGIEWDLQDLEDTVSIVKGDRHKSPDEQDSVEEQGRYIETTRAELEAIQAEVDGTDRGQATKRATLSLPGKSRGMVKLTQDDEPAGVELNGVGGGDEPSGGGGGTPAGERAQQSSSTRDSKALLADDASAGACGCCPGFLSRRARG